MNNKRSNLLPVCVLLLLAPITGELLSGSSPPAEYFQPIPFVLLTVLYGSGALIIREVVYRWNKGWVSILLLGMAYGIFEEGIMVRSFFNPNWMDLGKLATYGRWIGINWIWAVSLTIFHAVVSISIPIAITELLFLEQRKSLWLSDKGLIGLLILFLLNALLGPFFGMQISLMGMLASILSIIVLVVLANKWPSEPGVRLKGSISAQWKIISAGIILMLGLITGLWIMPSISIPWIFTFLFLCILPWVGVWWFNHLGKAMWKDRQKWAAAVGLLIPWLAIDIFSELENANRPDDTSGMSLVAVLFFAFLLFIRILIKRREAKTLSS